MHDSCRKLPSYQGGKKNGKQIEHSASGQCASGYVNAAPSIHSFSFCDNNFSSYFLKSMFGRIREWEIISAKLPLNYRGVTRNMWHTDIWLFI